MAMATATATATATVGFASPPRSPAAALRRLTLFPLSPNLLLAIRRCPPVAARRTSRLLASSSPVPPPPGEEGGDSSDDDFDPLAAMEAKMNRARDGVQIFFAVLFWMSLFFWASAWDSDDNKRSRKGGWFKR